MCDLVRSDKRNELTWPHGSRDSVVGYRVCDWAEGDVCPD